MDDRPHLRVVPHILQHVAIVHGHHAHHLGHVQRRAAAKADHGVGAMGLERRRASHHLCAGGVAKDTIKHADGQACRVCQQGLELRHHRQRSQRAVGDDQRALDAHVQQMR